MEKVKEYVGYLLVVLFVIGFFYGFVQFLMWDNREDKKRAEAECAQVAELAEVKERKVVDGQCVIIKDGKLVEIK